MFLLCLCLYYVIILLCYYILGLNDLSFSGQNCDFRQLDLVIAKAAVSSVFLTDPRYVVNYLYRHLRNHHKHLHDECMTEKSP